MSISIIGKVEQSPMSAGTWALNATTGETYEIYQDAPSGLLKAGQSVKVKGKFREDVMTVAMIGPVLQVESFEVM
jgi:hypothetical protein